jgi:hypothetical protein
VVLVLFRDRESSNPYRLEAIDSRPAFSILNSSHHHHHHLISVWPNLSMLSYQKSAPAVRAICAKHGIPYVKENVFLRVHKLTKVMVGTESMRWFPEDYERKHLQEDVAVLKKGKE